MVFWSDFLWGAILTEINETRKKRRTRLEQPMAARHQERGQFRVASCESAATHLLSTFSHKKSLQKLIYSEGFS
jgi:hypothetical protein